MNERSGERLTSTDAQGEFPFDVLDYVPHLIAAICQFRDAALNAELRDLGLNVARYRVLGVLSRFGLTSMGELANFTAIDRTTLTRTADHLVVEGYVARHHDDPRDRRHVRLELTEPGVAAYRRGLSVVLRSNADLMRDIADADTRTAARVLQVMVSNLAPNATARDSIVLFQRGDQA
jgi:DNA-binding MarR family transcriptional regulator